MIWGPARPGWSLGRRRSGATADWKQRAHRGALFAIGHELGAGNGDTYRQWLTEEAVVVVPGAVLDKAATVAG